MSNRRKPTRTIPLQGGPPPPAPRRDLPLPLLRVEWSDEPAAVYTKAVLDHLAAKLSEQNRLNAWRCEVCSVPFIAFDRHPGTTPMLVAHQTLDPDTDCTGMCASVFYSREGVYAAAVDLGQQQVTPSHEWYRPSAVELRAAPGGIREHVAQGGLLVREVAA